MHVLQSVVLIFAIAICCNMSAAAVPNQSRGRAIGVCLVAEFGYIPEARSWPKIEKESISPKDQLGVEQAWEMGWKKTVTDAITPEVVGQMVMPRDRKGMAAYTRVSPFANIDWQPVTKHESYVVFKGTADALPRISAIRRWLMIYCLYDTKQGSILRVTLTIHGERDE
jgi:hypothetical protein